MVNASEEVDKIANCLPVEDIVPVKIAVDTVTKPEIGPSAIHDKYYPEDKNLTTQAKRMRVTRSVKYVKSKYPEIFKPFRDPDIVNINEMVKDLVDMALDKENKVGDRIKAHKVILDTAVQAEKFSKDREISERTLETIAFEDKTFEDIINETRNKHVTTV